MLAYRLSLTEELPKLPEKCFRKIGADRESRTYTELCAGHLNLGVALLKLNDATGARQQFAETLRLDPANKSARSYLAAASQ
jgi:Tfp pilus assembly protein PilF